MTTVAQARAAGAKRYFTGKPCPKGHIAERYTARSVCVECHALCRARRYEANAEAEKKRIKAWGAAHPERVRGYKRAYKARNRT